MEETEKDEVDSEIIELDASDSFQVCKKYLTKYNVIIILTACEAYQKLIELF